MNPYAEKIKSLGLTLPPAPKPVGAYRPVIFSGNQAFLSGQITRKTDGTILTGKLGKDLNLAQGQEAARIAALNVLGVIHDLIGFDRFDHLIRITGYVQTAPDFYDISAVMNAASELFLDVFGEKGVHARSAVGMASLPMNAAVEIEATLQVRP